MIWSLAPRLRLARSSVTDRDTAIREAVGADAPRLGDLHGQGFERAWGIGEFESLLSEPNVLGHLAEGRFKRACGFVLSRLAQDEAEILSIVVAIKARRLGVGAALLERHLAALTQRGVRRLFLEVEEENDAACALYRRYGFGMVGKRSSYYKKADGSRPAALVMRRDF